MHMLYQLSHLPNTKLAPSVSLILTKVDSNLFRTQSQTLTLLKKSEVSRLNLVSMCYIITQIVHFIKEVFKLYCRGLRNTDLFSAIPFLKPPLKHS